MNQTSLSTDVTQTSSRLPAWRAPDEHFWICPTAVFWRRRRQGLCTSVSLGFFWRPLPEISSLQHGDGTAACLLNMTPCACTLRPLSHLLVHVQHIPWPKRSTFLGRIPSGVRCGPRFAFCFFLLGWFCARDSFFGSAGTNSCCS
jgi:hypothetical protein